MEQPIANAYDRWASNVALLYGLLFIGRHVYHTNGLFAADTDTLNRVLAVAVCAVCLAWAYYLRRGYRGLKMGYLVLFGMTMFQFVAYYQSGKGTLRDLSAWDASIKVIEVAIAVLVLLSLRTSGQLKRYYPPKK